MPAEQTMAERFTVAMNEFMGVLPTDEGWDNSKTLTDLSQKKDRCEALARQWDAAAHAEYGEQGAPQMRMIELVLEAAKAAGNKEYRRARDRFTEARRAVQAIKMPGVIDPQLKRNVERMEALREGTVAGLWEQAEAASAKSDFKRVRELYDKARDENTGPDGEQDRDFAKLLAGQAVTDARQLYRAELQRVFNDYMMLPASNVSGAVASDDAVFVQDVADRLRTVAERWASLLERDPTLRPTPEELAEMTRQGQTRPGGAFDPRMDLNSLAATLTALKQRRQLLEEAREYADSLRLEDAARSAERASNIRDLPKTAVEDAKARATAYTQTVGILQTAKTAEDNRQWAAAENDFEAGGRKAGINQLKGRARVAAARGALEQYAQQRSFNDLLQAAERLREARTHLAGDHSLAEAERLFQEARRAEFTHRLAAIRTALANSETLEAAGNDIERLRLITLAKDLAAPELDGLERLQTSLKDLRTALGVPRPVSEESGGPSGSYQVDPENLWGARADQCSGVLREAGIPLKWVSEAKGVFDHLRQARDAMLRPEMSRGTLRQYSRILDPKALRLRYPLAAGLVEQDPHVEILRQQLRERGRYTLWDYTRLGLAGLGVVLLLVTVGGVARSLWLLTIAVPPPAATPTTQRIDFPGTGCVERSKVPVCNFDGGPQFLTFLYNHPDILQRLGDPLEAAVEVHQTPLYWQQGFAKGVLHYNPSLGRYNVQVAGESGWTCYYLDPLTPCR